MTVDVGTTPRKPLSPTQRLKLFERERGLCCLCGNKIDGADWIDEHKRALGLGGSNDPENRGVAHPACAALKTNGPDGDLAKIAKAKRSKRKHLGIKSQPTSLSGPTYQERQARKSLRSAERRGPGKTDLKPRVWKGFESAGSWSER